MSAKTDIIAKYSSAPAAKPVPTLASPLSAAINPPKPTLPAATVSAKDAIIAKYSAPQKKATLAPNAQIEAATKLESQKPAKPVGTTISAAKPQSFGQKILSAIKAPFTESADTNAAKNFASSAISDLIANQNYTTLGKQLGLDKTAQPKYPEGLDPSKLDPITAKYYQDKAVTDEVKKNYNELSKTYVLPDQKTLTYDPEFIKQNLDGVTKSLGLRDNPTIPEIVGALSTLPVIAGMIELPAATALGIAGWQALSMAEKKILGGKELSDVVANKIDANEPTRDILFLLEMVGKGGILHSVYSSAPGVVDKFIHETAVTYNMPEKVYIDPAKVRSMFVNNDQASEAEQGIVKAVAGSYGKEASKFYVKALKEGVTVELPAEVLTRIIDKPWWATLKNAIGLKPTDTFVSSEKLGIPNQAVAGLLKGGTGGVSPELAAAGGGQSIEQRIGAFSQTAISEGPMPVSVARVLSEPASPETIRKIVDFSPEESAAFGKKIIGDINTALGTSINEKLGEALPDNIKLTENPSHDGRPAQFNNQGKIEIFLPDLVKDIKSMASGNQILAHDGKYSKVYKLEQGETINELAVRYIKDIIIHEASHQETLTIGDQTTALDLQQKIRQARVDGNVKEITRLQTELDKHRAGLETKALDYEALNRGALEKKYFTSPRSPSADMVIGKPKPKEVTSNEKALLKTKLKAEEKGSKSGLKEGKKQGRAEVSADEQNRANTREIGDQRQSELGKLKQRIVDRFRASKQVEGVKSQYRQAIDKIKDRNTTIQESRQLLTEYAKLVPAAVRGKFIVRIQNATSAKEFRDTIKRMREVTDLHERKIVRLEIKKVLKNTAVKKVNGYPSAKFEIQAQRDLNRIRAGIKEDYGDAQQKIADLIVKFSTENPQAQGIDDTTLREVQFLKMVGIRDMTAAELRFTLDNITSIKETGKTLKEIERANLAAEIEDSKERILDVVTGGAATLPSDRHIVKQEALPKGKVADFLGNQQRAFESSLNRLSRLDKGSKPYSSYLSEFMGRRTNAAFNQENIGEIDKIHEVADAMHRIYKAENDTELLELIHDLGSVVDLGPTEFADGKQGTEFKISRDQAIKKWMELQDPTLAERFSEGLNWGPAVIDKITNFLRPEDIEFGKFQLDFYRQYYAEINQVYSKEHGIDLPFNENYSPVMADVEETIPENVLLAKEMAKYATAKNASLKSRVDNKIPLKTEGSMNVLFRHIVRMEHYKAWSDTMMRFRKILIDKTVRQAVIDFHGKDKLQILDNYVNDFARGGIAREKIVSGLDEIRGSAAKSILGLNWRVGVKQLTGILDYAIELPFSDFSTGVASYWAHPLKNAKFLYEHSAGLRERFDEGYERDIKLAVSKNFAERLTNSRKLSEKFFTFIRTADKFTVNQGAWAAYRSRFMEARRAGMSIAEAEKEGIYYAEQLTNRVQESSRLDTLSPLQRGGSWAKLFTMFQSQQNKYYRVMTDALQDIKYGRGSRATNIKRLIMAWFIVPMIYNIVGNQLTPKKYQKKFGTLAKQTAIFGPASEILIIGQLVQSVYGWIEGDDFDYQPTAVEGFATDLKNGIQKFETGDNGTAITYLIDAMGKVSGVPTTVVTKQVRAGLK